VFVAALMRTPDPTLIAQSIGCRPLPRIAPCRGDPGSPAADAAQAGRTHQPGNALPAHASAFIAQLGVDIGAAVDVVGCSVQQPDALGENRIYCRNSAGAGFTSHNLLPDFTGSFRYDAGWGRVKAAGILRKVGFQNTLNGGGEPSGHKTGDGVNLTGTLKVLGKDRIDAGLVWGKAIASYMNDGGADLAPGPVNLASTNAEAVESLGRASRASWPASNA
jgi:hypothetical protein